MSAQDMSATPRPGVPSSKLRLAGELAVLALVPLVLAWLIFTPGYSPDPDAGFHVGCARLYATRGWIGDFPWLGYTALAEHFPNVYLLQHLLLAPIAVAFEPEMAVYVSTWFLGSALAVSLWLVLRRWRVPYAALWSVLGLFVSQYSVTYMTSLKGGSTFYILLPWFADAVWSRATKRAFVLSWLSVYVYVGASILLPMVVVFVLVCGLWERSWPWRLIVAVLGGVACGMLVNPFWPGHWAHTLHELGSVFLRTSPEVEAIRGGEWMALQGPTIVTVAGPMLVAWGACLVLHMRRGERTSPGAAAGALVALGLFGGSLLGGAKILYLFLLVSAIFLPLLARELGRWPRWVAVAVVLLGAGNAAANVDFRYHNRDRFPPLAEYRAMAKLLERETAEGELVLAPWDDFCGLFLFDTRNRYVAGFNVEFLQRTDPERFRAYYLLYEGESADPARTLTRRFEGARFVLVRRTPRRPGEGKLAQTLAAQFNEFVSPAKSWRLFQMRPQPPGKAPRANGQPATEPTGASDAESEEG